MDVFFGTFMKMDAVVISPGQAHHSYWLEIWRYRDLLFQLMRKDILLRFRQTAVGTAWVILRPLVFMAVLVFVFGQLAKLPSGEIPYPVFVLSALIPWQFATSALTTAASSVVQNSHLVNKIYFPRLIIPLSSLGAPVVELGISLVLLLILMFWNGYYPRWQLLCLPVMIIWLSTLSFGLGLWFSSLSVMHRDFLHILPVIVQVSLYLSPVGYSVELIPDAWKPVYAINPLVGFLEVFRWTLLGDAVQVHVGSVLLSLVISTGILVSGLWCFRKQEATFSDVI
jgi:lipopolysaccharide transport system permease protein